MEPNELIDYINDEITGFYNAHDRFPVCIEVNKRDWDAVPHYYVEKKNWAFRCTIPVHVSRTEKDYHLLEHFRNEDQQWMTSTN